LRRGNQLPVSRCFEQLLDDGRYLGKIWPLEPIDWRLLDPDKQVVIEACKNHVALNIIANRIEEVVTLREKEAIMITFKDFDLHEEVENAVQDPRNNGEKIMIGGRFYRISVAPIDKPVDPMVYELYFGNFPGFARVLPIRTFLYSKLKIHIKYITCPPGRAGGRSNFLFVGLPNKEAVNRIIEVKKAGGFEIGGKKIIIAESQSMVKKNGCRVFPLQLDRAK